MLSQNIVQYLCSAIIALILLFSGVSRADSPSVCKELSDKAYKEGSISLGADAGRIVIGKGRLQFYSAPSYSCKMLGIFMLKNENVVAYATFGHFTSVAYLNGKGSGPVTGWVESNRLKPNGLGIAPRQPGGLHCRFRSC
jgi:hypothetical protein